MTNNVKGNNHALQPSYTDETTNAVALFSGVGGTVIPNAKLGTIEQLNTEQLAKAADLINGQEPPMVDTTQTPLWEIDERVLNPFVELPPAMTWGHINGRPAIEKQGVIAFSGKWKSGKSLGVYALMTSIVSGKPLDTYTPTSEPPRLAIVFDTEMSKSTLQRRARGIYKMLEGHGNRFMIVPLLPVPNNKRRAVIEDIVSKYNPEIIGIDVVTNMVADVNNPSEAAAFREWLDKLSVDRTVFTVIHQNKSKEDSNAVGHLGSKIMEVCTECFTVAKKDTVFTITPTASRNSCVEGASGVSFIYTDEGLFTGAAQTLAHEREMEAERWRANFRMIFDTPDELLRHNALCKRLREREGIPESAAKRKVTLAKESGAIRKVDESDPNSPYQLV